VGLADREDLEQVARLALLQAARRFDPARGCQFSSFATEIIQGHLRHYLRDRVTTVRIPRLWWELSPSVLRLRERLLQALGREPTADELAVRLGVSERHVLGALGTLEFYRLESLDVPGLTTDGEETESLADRLGEADRRLEMVEQQIALEQVIQRLPSRLREVLQQRYFQGCSQRQVAGNLGISQMQISRPERKALAQLREELCSPAHGWL
jgi:RNA polymerase sigma-B factor